MYEEEIHFGKLLLKQSETILSHLTLMTLTFEEGRSRGSPVIDQKRF